MKKWYDTDLWQLLIYVLGMLLIAFFLSGCKSSFHTMKPEVSHYETDSFTSETKQNVLRWDSIVKRDSTYVKDSVAIRKEGDTIFVERWHWEYIYDFFHLEKMNLENKQDMDFRFIARSDTIRVPYPVEKQLSKWEQFQLKYANWSFGALCVLLVVLGYKLYKKIKNGRFNYINQEK